MDRLASIMSGNICCEFEIDDVVNEFNSDDVNWISDYPLYFQKDLMKLFWMYCLENFCSSVDYRNKEEEIQIINDILTENNLPTITKEEAFDICHRKSKINLNEFNKFIVYVINALYPKILINHKIELIRLTQLKDLVHKMIIHNNECKSKNQPTNFDKLCNYINKYMKVIQIGNYWTNRRSTINEAEIKIHLYYESDETGDHHLAMLLTDNYDGIEFRKNQELPTNEFNNHEFIKKNETLIRALNISLHLQTRTEFMKTRMTNNIKLYALLPWNNKLIKFKYQEKMNILDLN